MTAAGGDPFPPVERLRPGMREAELAHWIENRMFELGSDKRGFDFIVASVLMALGMMMVPPTLISLPLKLLLFVLMDGWGLVVQTLITSR